MPAAKKNILLSALTLAFLLPNLTAFSQESQKLYIGFTPVGVGLTFTRVDWRDSDNKANYLRPWSAGPTLSGGIKLRYDFTEKLSLRTGVMATMRAHRAVFPKDETFGIFLIFERLGYTSFHNWDMVVPLELTMRVPINKRRGIFAGFTGGAALNLMIKPSVTKERAAYHDAFLDFFAPPDSVAYSFFSFQHKRSPVQGMLVLGVGIEKVMKKCIVGFNIVSYTGFSKVYTGDFYFYDTRVYHTGDHGRHPSISELPPQAPTEHAKVFSRNSSIMLQLDFMFPVRK